MSTIQTNDLSNTFKALRESKDPLKVANQKIESHPDYKRIPNRNYGPVAAVETGSWGGSMTRTASNAGIMYGQPQFFSPVHTPINWQIPSKRLEIYQWSRFFYENEPKVASAIDFYSLYPMSGWTLECKDRKVKNHFDKLNQKINLIKWCRLISHEVHLMGDCFVNVEVECEHCGGLGRVGSEICEHEGGTVKRVSIFNPDQIDVVSGPLSEEPLILFRAGEDLMKQIGQKIPGYEKLSPEVIKLIMSGQPIPLSGKSVCHLKYGENGYTPYGLGMVKRLFPILSYKTKLMMAQWNVAERLILPIKIVKVGTDERPAGPADIAAVQAQLAQTANDPNLTIVTHNAFEMQWVGASGQVLTLSNEFENINQEILDGLMINNALLNGEGPAFCLSDDTRIMTNNGLKSRNELDPEKDLIATFNKDTGALEYQKAIRKYEYAHNSIDGNDAPLKRFLTNKIDMLVTDNHKMLFAPRVNKKGQAEEWKVDEAKNVKVRSRFRACFDSWVGTTEDKKEYFGIKTEDFLKIAGWYASEGWRVVDKKRKNKVYRVGIAQSPSANPLVFKHIKGILEKYNICNMYPSRDDAFYISNTTNKQLTQYLSENFGHGAESKKIPSEIKNMSQENLRILLKALVDGDGNERPATKKKATKKQYFTYFTISKQLRDDVLEILFKLGYSPKFIKRKNPFSEKCKDIYNIYWSDNENIGRFPTLASRDMGKKPQVTRQVIFDVPYKGTVWCVEVPNHFILTERNGIFGIHGNSSASVGIEATIERLKTFRDQISEWIYKYIYIPEAKRQGFIEKFSDGEEKEYIVPKIKWNKMNLRDEQQNKTFAIQLYEKGLLSANTLLELFEYDPDQEIERKRYDAVQMMALGQAPQGQGGEGGGGAGGMPSLGGGGGGLGDIGGLGGGDMGGGGEPPIGAPEGGGGDAGPVVAKSSNLSNVEIADIKEFGGKVLTQKSRERFKMDQQKIFDAKNKAQSLSQQNVIGGGTRDEKGRIVWTKPERQLIDLIIQKQKDGIIRYKVQPQFEVSSGTSHYMIDFAIIPLKLGIEADGETFHGSDEQKQRDQERDMKLSQQGWTIIRFTDTEIDKQPQQVINAIIKQIMQKEMWVKQQVQNIKKAENNEIVKTAEAIKLLEESNLLIEDEQI